MLWNMFIDDKRAPILPSQSMLCFQVLNFTYVGMKNVRLGKVVIQNWDHPDIKTISASPIGGLNCEVPLFIENIVSYENICKRNYWSQVSIMYRFPLLPIINSVKPKAVLRFADKTVSSTGLKICVTSAEASPLWTWDPTHIEIRWIEVISQKKKLAVWHIVITKPSCWTFCLTKNWVAKVVDIFYMFCGVWISTLIHL